MIEGLWVMGPQDTPRAGDATPQPNVALRLLFACGGALFLFLLVDRIHPLVATAATIPVTNITDTTTTGDGVSLREAILSLNAGSDLNSDVVAARSGTYGGHNLIVITAPGTIILSTANGTLTLAANVDIGEVVANATIDGNCTVNRSGNCISGGVRVLTVNSGFTVSIGGLTIQHGNAGTGSGGAIANTGILTLTDCTLLNNTGGASGGTGGAIFNGSGGALTLENTTFAGNAANTGGGIYSVGSVTMTNSTVSGNSATNAGGGLVRAAGTFTMLNSLVASNIAPSNPDVSGGFGSSGHNLVGIVGTSVGFTVAGDLTGTDTSPINPLLGPLGTYGATTAVQTFPLLPGSPAIDAGTATGAPASDARGLGRFGAAPDIGAFESRGFTSTVVDGGNQAAQQNHQFGGALTMLVTAHNQVEPVQGGVVTFAVSPVGGASAVLAGSPATITANSVASATATANGTAGAYTVTGSAAGMPDVAFNLTNGTVACMVTGVLDPEETGRLTLRDAVDSADGGACIGGLISFDPTTFPPATPRTVALNGTSGPLTLTPVGGQPTSLTIDGSGHMAAISGVGATRLFTIDGRVTLTLINLILRDGDPGSGQNGGAVLNFGALNATNCRFLANEALNPPPVGGGGAIFNNGGTVNITGSAFLGNSAGGTDSHSGGGAIFNSGGTLTVAMSTFASNGTTTTSTGGGAIHSLGGTVMITGSTFSNNTTSNGAGAILAFSTMVVANSTFSGNVGGNGPGGAILVHTSGSLVMENSTIAGNSGVSGGGVFNGGTANLTNTIVAGNSASTGPDVSGAFTSGGHNLIGKRDGSSGFTVAGDLTGTTATPLDPHLAPLADNGGPTQTLALLPGSAAIDTADPLVCASPPVSGKDQRGIPRRANRCSIGADEANPATPDPLPAPAPPGATLGLPNPLPAVRSTGSTPGSPSPLPDPRP